MYSVIKLTCRIAVAMYILCVNLHLISLVVRERLVQSLLLGRPSFHAHQVGLAVGVWVDAAHDLAGTEAHERVLLHAIDSALLREVRRGGVISNNEEVSSLLILLELQDLRSLLDHSVAEAWVGVFLVEVGDVGLVVDVLGSLHAHGEGEWVLVNINLISNLRARGLAAVEELDLVFQSSAEGVSRASEEDILLLEGVGVGGSLVVV